MSPIESLLVECKRREVAEAHLRLCALLLMYKSLPRRGVVYLRPTAYRVSVQKFMKAVAGLKREVGGGAEFDEGRSGKTLLRIRITAEVDGVRSEYTITFCRYGRDNAVLGFAVARADAPDDREKDAKRLAALIKALTGVEPRAYRMKDGKIRIECGKEHLDGFARYAELADAIAKWLEETRQ